MTTAAEASRSAAEWALEGALGETHDVALEAEYKEFQRRCRLRLNATEKLLNTLNGQIRALENEREFLLKHASPEGR